MPITNCTQLVRFSEGCGAEIPRWILKQLKRNPQIKTYKELETLYNKKQKTKEVLWMNM